MSRDPFYNKRDWRDRIQPRQLAREPMCQWPDCTRPTAVADHIQPIRQGGATRDPANLQSLCDHHHNMKRAAERHGQDWRKIAYRGCDEFGIPRDPSHPWAVRSPDRHDRRPAPTLENELVNRSV